MWRSKGSKPRAVEHPNIFNLKDLRNVKLPCCGRILRLERLPGTLFDKLKDVLENAYLEKIHLLGCFSDANHTEEVLKSIQKNSNLKKIDLSLRCNVYNDNCVNILEELIRTERIKSFEFPDEVWEQSTEKLLQAVVDRKSDIKALILRNCELSPNSVNILRKIVKKGKVSEKLDLSACTGIPAVEIKATLTSEDRKVIDAQPFYKNLTIFKKLQIIWFKEEPKLEVSKLNKGQFKMLQAFDRHDFDGYTGDIVTTTRFLVGEVSSQAIQFFCGDTRKRKSEPKEREGKKRKINVDSLCDKMASACVDKPTSESHASADCLQSKKRRASEQKLTTFRAASTTFINNYNVTNVQTVDTNENSEVKHKFYCQLWLRESTGELSCVLFKQIEDIEKTYYNDMGYERLLPTDLPLELEENEELTVGIQCLDPASINYECADGNPATVTVDKTIMNDPYSIPFVRHGEIPETTRQIRLNFCIRKADGKQINRIIQHAVSLPNNQDTDIPQHEPNGNSNGHPPVIFNLNNENKCTHDTFKKVGMQAREGGKIEQRGSVDVKIEEQPSQQ